MFTDITLPRRNAFSLARSLTVITMVIAIRREFAAITAEDQDANLTVVAQFAPFA